MPFPDMRLVILQSIIILVAISVTLGAILYLWFSAWKRTAGKTRLKRFLITALTAGSLLVFLSLLIFGEPYASILFSLVAIPLSLVGAIFGALILRAWKRSKLSGALLFALFLVTPILLRIFSEDIYLLFLKDLMN